MAATQPIALTLTRARATRSAQNSVKDVWVWDEKTIADWDAAIADTQAGQQAVAANEADLLARRGSLDNALSDLADQTRRGLALAKIRYRNDGARRTVVARLTGRSDSRTRALESASAWASAWAELDPAFAPTTGSTLAAFNTLRARCETLQNEYAQARADLRASAETQNRRAARLDGDCKAWYAAATRIFPASTAEGAMIRGTIPTSYSKETDIGVKEPAAPAPPPA